jgi:2-polyprenyl-6-methoxyphenol hydroxylase-like FAD-dependent oxidoreductase
VVVVGTGPAGLVTAITPAGHGVGVLLVERNPRGTVQPVGFAGAAQSSAASQRGRGRAPRTHLEPVLLGQLRRLPAAQVRFGTELAGFHHDEDGVALELAGLLPSGWSGRPARAAAAG